MSQKGKVGLVTGGAQGIGRAITESLLAEGASVAVLDVNQAVGEATVKELSQQYPEKVIFLYCDVTNHDVFEECFKKTLQKFSQLDIVVNNAGVGVEQGDAWGKLIDINFIAVVKGIKLGMKYMGKDNGGRGGTIVNIASIAAGMICPTSPIYAATKAAVNHISRSFGDDLYLKRSGVKVIAISPGYTDTELAKECINSCDEHFKDSMTSLLGQVILQNASTIGLGLIEILKECESGSLWEIKDCKPPTLMVVQ